MEKDTQIARLVVDCSSIPGFEGMFPAPPKLFYRHFPETPGAKGLVDKILEYENPTLNVFQGIQLKMKKNESLRFEFSTDIDTISNIL